MDIKRFYVDKENIVGNVVKIDGDEYLHLTKVLRHKVGYKIIICNNFDGFDYYATIFEIDKSFALATIDEKVYNNAVCKYYVQLFFALPKGDKIDLIVQKAVELGINEIVVFKSRYVTEEKFNLERLKKISIEACKQCGRAYVPNIFNIMEYEEAIKYASQCDIAMMAYEKEEVFTAKTVFSKLVAQKTIGVIIGSEGGFSENEVSIARDLGVKTFSLGKRILRCETAGIVACSLLMYEIGELGGR